MPGGFADFAPLRVRAISALVVTCIAVIALIASFELTLVENAAFKNATLSISWQGYGQLVRMDPNVTIVIKHI